MAGAPWVGIRAAAPKLELLDTRVITPPDEAYGGWPTVGRRAGGELWVVWSGGREGHICPFGQVRAMKSADGGVTWTHPRVLLDSPLDDRDAGFLETKNGTLLVTTFTSLAYEDRLMSKPESTQGWPEEKRRRWEAERDWLGTAAERRAFRGQWMLRSTDGGVTWSNLIPTILNSPHGPIQLSDGRLLYPGKGLWTDEQRIGVAESTDDGLTWSVLSDIEPREGDKAGPDYHELHGVEAADGRIVVQIRNHSTANKGETLQTESRDGGRTWSPVRPIGVWGLPSHLLRLRDGRLLMSYGHRRAPFGNQARISEDHGETWSEPLLISGDGVGGDLGYPSTVELDDGTLLTVWYEKMSKEKDGVAVLRQARWKLA
jgi:sialidase-1